MSYFLHPSSIVDDNVNIGEGTKIWHFSHILSNVRIGENCVLGQNVMVGLNVKIGNGVKIQNNVSIYEGVELSDDVFIGPSVVFTNVLIPRSFINRKHEFKPTVVSYGASIGANATIVCGVKIGEYALIGAGAVIIHDVPAYNKIVGNPGRFIGWVCKCGESLKLAGVCNQCGMSYENFGGNASLK